MQLSPSILAAFAALSLLPAQEGKKLTINPKAGEVANYRHTQTATQTMEAMGQESTNETVTDLEVKIDEVKPDGTVHATVTWKRIRGSMGGPAAMEFDTAKKDGEEAPGLEGVLDAYHALVGAKQKVIYDATGDVKEVPDFQKTLEAAMANVNGMAKMMMQGTLSESAMKQQFALFATLPKDSAKDGTWTRKRDASARGGLAMAMETTHKFASQSADGYETSFTGTVKPAPAKADEKQDGDDDEEGGQMAMMRNMMKQAKVDGKIEGTQKAGKDGMIATSTATTSMKIEMPNPMGGDEPFVVAVKTVTKIERVTADAKADKPAGDKAPATDKAPTKK